MLQNSSITLCKCRICSWVGSAPTIDINEMMFGSRKTFHYFACPSCECLQILEIPANLEQYYPSNYYSQVISQEPENSKFLRKFLTELYAHNIAVKPKNIFSKILKKILPQPYDYKNHGLYLENSKLKSYYDKILDVGSGSSPHRLAAFKRLGFKNVLGIDAFIPSSLEYYGIPVKKTTLDEIDDTFGLIMFHHSLEHMQDPVSTLRKASSLLQKGGCCLVRIPVMGTYFWNNFGTSWVEIDAPRHLHLLSVHSMEILAKLTGFRISNIIYDSMGWELAWSEIYKTDHPMYSPESNSKNSLSGFFSNSELARFEAEATILNEKNDAGRAAFYLIKE